MHKKAAFIFWLTLTLYVITLLFASYVGVYLTYVAIPIIVISGLIMMLAKPTMKHEKEPSRAASVVYETSKTASALLDDLSSRMDEVARSLEKFNMKTQLIRERTQEQKAEIRRLEASKVTPEIELRHATDTTEKHRHQSEIDKINKNIHTIKEQIRLIEKQCEIEIHQSQG